VSEIISKGTYRETFLEREGEDRVVYDKAEVTGLEPKKMAAAVEEKVAEKTQGQGTRRSALKARSPGSGAEDSPVTQPPVKSARVGGDGLPPVAEFPFRGSAGSGAGSAGASTGFVAAAVGRLGGGLGGGAVENGLGLERAGGNLAGHGVTQERAAEEERGDKGVWEEAGFQGGPGSEGKFGKGGSQEAGFQGGPGSEGAGGVPAGNRRGCPQGFCRCGSGSFGRREGYSGRQFWDYSRISDSSWI